MEAYPLTALAEILRDRIERDGPISFEAFMDAALYYPRLGYYRRARDPFGKDGDFYTASQLQPVFGRLIAAYIRALRQGMKGVADFRVIELGPGRGEMAAELSEFAYEGVGVGAELPRRFSGVLLANEFFDALPVHVAMYRNGEYHERLVSWAGGRFEFIDGPTATGAMREYIARNEATVEDGTIVEVNLRALEWLDRMADCLAGGFLLAIDYGYTERELLLHPRGTLMSYRKHRAYEDVLDSPGEQDITAHVAFTAMERHATANGWRRVRFDNLARLLLDAGETDQFASALAALSEVESQKLRMQLKALLYGMGETFRCLLLERV